MTSDLDIFRTTLVLIRETELAVRAGHQVRPDMTASEILAMVRKLQHS